MKITPEDFFDASELVEASITLVQGYHDANSITANSEKERPTLSKILTLLNEALVLIDEMI